MDSSSDVTSLARHLLVAVPQLQDPNFHRSVVLILDHGPEGSLGLVINAELPASLNEVAESLDLVWEGDPDAQVRSGGPVEPIRGWILHDRDDWDEGHTEIFDGMHMTTSLEGVKQSGQQNFGAEGSRFLFLLGYAGWAPGQLESEIAAGSWVTVPVLGETAPENGMGVSTDWFYDTDPGDMWASSLHAIGVDPQRLVGLQGSGRVLQ